MSFCIVFTEIMVVKGSFYYGIHGPSYNRIYVTFRNAQLLMFRYELGRDKDLRRCARLAKGGRERK